MEYFGITDKGRVRPTNQDIYRIEACPDRDSALVLVCDGMGGANAGNVASRFAAERFVEEAKPALETGADEITVEPRDQLGEIATYLPKLAACKSFAGTWLYTPEFKDEWITRRLKWQFWTFRYE